ncbi:peptidase associated/transthyretin-like domain-containing protein [Flavobacterium silvaticum]|uniref:Carboxypeptidase regulatory-like domain-containing protein n=1 Tax=Flavobacterium silvaticum TaxID=1852020 RepID=A0A972FNP5_9FLAO|nr:carboxypeptidase-like regulatory domain-containing protein [Flavobacterium silvaticum]NMH26599.1 carboxypeptidase regulatory-like domain-containing protein [Flavobacterium silvaticum]
MKKLILLLFCTPLLLASMCEDDDDNLSEPCSQVAAYGLNIQVQDAETGVYFYSQMNVSVQDGTYSDLLGVAPQSDPPTYIGALERTGTYVITVTKSGYETYVSDPVVVTANSCHVIPQFINIQLQPQ